MTFNRNLLFSLFLSLIVNSAFAQQPGLNWMKHIGASGEGFVGAAMVIDSNKAVIVAGNFRGTADFDDGPGVFNMSATGDQDIFITEYDSAGNFHWAKHIGGLLGDEVKELKLDQKGNILILGMFQGTVDMDPGLGTVNVTAQGSDAFVTKLDNNGNFIWSKQWQVYSINTMETDVNNNILLGGDFGGPADFDPGTGIYTMTGGNLYTDLFICKIDENGNFKWAKQMPNQSTGSSQELTMESDSKGNVFMGGNFTQSLDFDPASGTAILTSNGDNDGFVVKLDSNGIFSWVKQFGGATTDKVWSVELDHNDQLVLTGQYNGTVDFDPGTGVFNLSNATNRGCFIVKLDNAGNLIFAKTFTGEAFGECVTFDAANNIYISGGFYNTVDFDPGAATHSLTEGNIFITKLNSSGDYVWAVQFLNAIVGGYESIYCKIKVDALKNIYYTGLFPFAVDFDPGTSTYIVMPYGSTDVPIVKLFGGNCQTPVNNMIIATCNSYVLNGITYSASGTYNQTLSNASGCDSLISLTLTILPKPAPNLGTDTSLCSNQTLQLNPGSFSSYQWSDGSNNSSLSVNVPGTYWVTVTNSSNCTARDSITVFPATGCNNGSCVLTSETKLFPNPFYKNLIINKNITTCEVKLNLYNAIGQLLIKDYLLTDGVNTIDLSQLPAGVYFYKLHTTDAVLKTGRVVKMNN